MLLTNSMLKNSQPKMNQWYFPAVRFIKVLLSYCTCTWPSISSKAWLACAVEVSRCICTSCIFIAIMAPGVAFIDILMRKGYRYSKFQSLIKVIEQFTLIFVHHHQLWWLFERRLNDFEFQCGYKNERNTILFYIGLILLTNLWPKKRRSKWTQASEFPIRLKARNTAAFALEHESPFLKSFLLSQNLLFPSLT